MTALAAFGGAAAAVGVVLFVVELFVGAGGGWLRRRPTRRRTALDVRRIAVLLALPITMWVVTGWPIAALATLAALLGLPRVMGARRAARRRIARLEGLATWVRRVSDLLAAGLGLEHALQASGRSAPDPVQEEVSRLTWRLRAGSPTTDALRAFAEELDDSTGDLVTAALILAANRRGRGLSRTLVSLAETLDAEVSMRRQVEADRATPRTTVRYVTAITVVAVVALVLFDHSYLHPFSSGFGQFALVLASGLFAVSFLWMHRLVADEPETRFLGPTSGGRG